MTTALADTKHYGCNWNISSADQRSRVHTWTAKTTSSKYYITTRANAVNVGAEDTYYKVALKSGGSASARVRCNAGRLQERAISVLTLSIVWHLCVARGFNIEHGSS